VTKAAVAVMGDLADALGPNTKLLFRDRGFYIEFLGECLQSDDESIKETATWTQGMIGRVMVSCDEASWFVSTTAMSGFFFFFSFFLFIFNLNLCPFKQASFLLVLSKAKA